MVQFTFKTQLHYVSMSREKMTNYMYTPINPASVYVFLVMHALCTYVFYDRNPSFTVRE